MAKNSITDYSKTASLNTDIQSVDIDEGCLPSGINNAIREIMADLAAVNDGTVSLTSPSFAAASLTGNLSFGDNDKAIFGAGSDLQIYHDGSHSNIKDAGTGNLRLQGDNLVLQNSDATKNYAVAVNGGAIDLRHNNSVKLATTATGIDVTGTVTADSINFNGLSPTVAYDFSGNGSVTSADGLDYLQMGSGAATGVDISSVDTITPSWSALSGSIYSDNKFRIMSARGNSTDALRIVTSLTAEGHGDTTIIGNVEVDGVDTRIITGLGISGDNINLLSDGSKRLNIASNGDISFYEDTGTTAKLFWDASAERLGLGTSSPSYDLNIKSRNTTEDGILVQSSGSDNYGLYIKTAFASTMASVGALNQSDGTRAGASIDFVDFGRQIAFATNAGASKAERLRIDSTGRVGIGTSSPTEKLHVSGNILATGNITAYSDERLKSDIETLDGSKVYEMRGVSYIKDGEASSGVIAQELQKVAPELVSESGEYLSVAYGNLVGYLIEAVKELKAEIEELKNASSD